MKMYDDLVLAPSDIELVKPALIRTTKLFDMSYYNFSSVLWLIILKFKKNSNLC
jgi:hypothetical protein